MADVVLFCTLHQPPSKTLERLFFELMRCPSLALNFTSIASGTAEKHRHHHLCRTVEIR